MLTHQQEKYASLVADGKSQAEAYRTAYPKSQKWKPEAVYSKASELMANGNVSQRVAELRQQLSDTALWTRQESVEALKKAQAIAEDGNQSTGITAAVKELNAMFGFNAPSKHEISGANGAPMPVVIKIVAPKE